MFTKVSLPQSPHKKAWNKRIAIMTMRLSRSIVGEAEAAAVSRVILEDGYLGMGAEVQRFEAEVAAFLGVEPWQVISVNTGTAAVHLAVEACCRPGDEVLVPSLTFVASFQGISAARCVPVACDVREDSATLDLQDAEKRLTEKTRAVMPVHYASNPWQLDEIYAFAARHGLRVVEDAAHAFGCTSKGRKVGSFGDVVCFSFDGIKNITCGEGGCIVAFDKETARLCSDARLLSVENDAEKRFSGARSWEFDVSRQGWRYHMSNIMAAVGRVQLARLAGEFAPARRSLAARYRAGLAAVPGLALLHTAPDCDVVPHIFPVRVLGGKKDAVKEKLAAAGVPTGVHYKPNHLLSFYKTDYALPVTEKLFAELVTLPLHPGLSQADVDLVIGALREAMGEAVA